MTIDERLQQINKLLNSLDSDSIKPLFEYLEADIEALTLRLIAEDNEQVRGRIKALQGVLKLSDSLKYEKYNLEMSEGDQE